LIAATQCIDLPTALPIAVDFSAPDRDLPRF
jgi:hypothetical protein